MPRKTKEIKEEVVKKEAKTKKKATTSTTNSNAKKKTATKKTAVKKATTKKTATKKVIKKEPLDPTLEVVKVCVKALDDKKADCLKVLDVRGKSPITNYFIIATATSEPHLRALAGELEKTVKELGIKAVGRDYNTSSGWVVVDAFDFMAHIFLPEQRNMYGIESLWKDAQELSL